MLEEQRLHQEKKGIFISISAYVITAATKILIGSATGSRGLVADGWNNISDVLVSVTILIGLTIASKPADRDHRYGHFRAETVAALIAALLMGIVGLEVMKSAVTVLLSGEQVAAPQLLSLYVAGGSACVMYAVYRYNRRVAEQTKNLAVLAAAYDNRSDALVSLGAMTGIAASRLGWYWADPVLAVAVGAIILRTAWKVGAEAVHSLTDRFEEEKLALIEKQIGGVEGVREIIDLRARYHGSTVHVDVTIGVDQDLTVAESHELTELLEKKLIGYKNIGRVYVHVEPAGSHKSRG